MKQQRIRIVTDEGREVEALAPTILSVSRATDIPAFYSDWFFDRLKKGYCRWRNPFNGVDSYISFKNVRFIVFWSKNPAPLIPYLEILREKGINCYVQYTFNDYVEEGLEPNVPSLDIRIETFQRLSEMMGKYGVIWRFDPLVLTDDITIDTLLKKIEKIGDVLSGFTHKLVFSFADISSYRKVSGNLNRYGVKYKEWTESEMLDFAEKLAIQNKHKQWNFQLATCGEKINLEPFGIQHNRCVDDELITRIAWKDESLMKSLGMKIVSRMTGLFGEESLPQESIELDAGHYAVRTRSNRDKGQRSLCGCISSKDIGQYNTCPHGCLYCYANDSPESAGIRYGFHNKNQDMIIV